MYEIFDVVLDDNFNLTEVVLRNYENSEILNVKYSQLFCYKVQATKEKLYTLISLRKLAMCAEKELLSKGFFCTKFCKSNNITLNQISQSTEIWFSDIGKYKDAIGRRMREVLKNVYGVKENRYYWFYAELDSRYNEYLFGTWEKKDKNKTDFVETYLKMQLERIESKQCTDFNSIIELCFGVIQSIYSSYHEVYIFAIKVGSKALVRNDWHVNKDNTIKCIEAAEVRRTFKKVARITSKRKELGISRVSERYGVLIENKKICSLIKEIMEKTVK